MDTTACVDGDPAPYVRPVPLCLVCICSASRFLCRHRVDFYGADVEAWRQ
jgi:hypothetical protein